MVPEAVLIQGMAVPMAEMAAAPVSQVSAKAVLPKPLVRPPVLSTPEVGAAAVSIKAAALAPAAVHGALTMDGRHLMQLPELAEAGAAELMEAICVEEVLAAVVSVSSAGDINCFHLSALYHIYVISGIISTCNE